MIFRSAVVLSVIANFLVCGSAFSQSSPSDHLHNTAHPSGQNSAACSVEPELQKLLDLHNQSRSRGLRCGAFFKRRAPSLLWSCELARASKKHADDMAINDFLAHQGSDGSSIGERASRAGFEWREISENIAQGYDSPQQVYSGWLDSRAHCKNIISRKYQEFGAAKIDDYWVVMLGRR